MLNNPVTKFKEFRQEIMKIAMIGHKRIPSREGGIEIVVTELTSRMAALGNQVTAYNRAGSHVSGSQFSTAEKQKEYKNVKIITVPTPKSSKLNAIVYSALASIRASFSRFDVVHFHAEGPAAMCFLPKLFGKKIVVTIHGLDWQRSKWGGFATKFLLFGEKTAVKYADEIIVLSVSAQNYFLEKYGRKTVFIPNGITKPKKLDADIITEKFGLKKSNYLLYLGRIVPEKGIHYLIDAYKKSDIKMPLVIAGGSSHTEEYFAQLKNSAKDENIIFTDFADGDLLAELYSNAYIYILPSDLEGMPLSLLEAMSFGNCCLTSDIAECTEVCEENAVYFKKSDIDDLSKKLCHLVNNPDEVQQYKKISANYITAKYNWDKITEKTLSLYEK